MSEHGKTTVAFCLYLLFSSGISPSEPVTDNRTDFLTLSSILSVKKGLHFTLSAHSFQYICRKGGFRVHILRSSSWEPLHLSVRNTIFFCYCSRASVRCDTSDLLFASGQITLSNMCMDCMIFSS